ncbi:hypothetical protein PSA7680_01354 [Pseudoruegeria aquimaris]|uniref:Uncharacterized protein n=1 Tax=Pseudoruegeria aquimaris TaxID=393663 RepID=A0A1Y5RZI6_9RHOB|nr:ABZJ_00895 family protein [Pseudoruegeria aquimaris]SLN29210.1 hypothetical protein PSA7680_01354 [Pseudoruegeria aquimaris]
MKPNLIRYGGTVIATVFALAILNALTLQYLGVRIPPAATVLVPLMLAAAREGQIAARGKAPAPDLKMLAGAAGLCTLIFAVIALCLFVILRLTLGEAFTMPGGGAARYGLTLFTLVAAFVVNASFLSIGHRTEARKLAQKAGE